MKNLYDLRIASIQDDYRVVLNAGSEDGISEDMEFVIFTPGEEIFDPETDESLGHLELVKGRVEVVHVQASMSIGRSSQFSEQKYPVERPLALFGSINALSSERPYDMRQIRLKLKNIAVGDRVRRIS